MKRALLVIGALWIAILGTMIAVYEYRLRTGREVLLKTVPVDPRDFFRGDYVTLGYEIGLLDLTQVRYQIANYTEGQPVYMLLKTEGEYAVAERVQVKRPDSDAFFIKGRVQSVHGKRMRIEYGIESYFVPEGQGHVLEGSIRPDVRVAIDHSGRAIIKTMMLNGSEVTFPAKPRGK